jgi:tripartite-type tricarboxylate transporter receptor subunit TctC
MTEQGFDLKLDGWYGILAPAGTPDAIVQRVYAETMKILTNPELHQTFVDLNLPPPPRLSSEDFAAVIKAEIPMWRKIVIAADVKPE